MNPASNMRAIVHSIHSQVPQTIRGLNRHFKTILSLDSHLDVSLGGDYSVYPEKLRIIAQRTSVHSALRDVTGGISSLGALHKRRKTISKVVVAIPALMLAKHAEDVELGLPLTLRTSVMKESISSVVKFLRSAVGVDVFQSPPRSLMALIPSLGGKSWLLDVDVDYMREMQDECYTQIRNTAPGILQSMSNVLTFIESAKPEIITISEARVSAIRGRSSTFSSFLGRLEGIGYAIEESGVYGSDAEVLRGISVCQEFYKKTSRRLMVDHMETMMTGDLRGFEKEEAAAAREFFRSRGYSV